MLSSPWQDDLLSCIAFGASSFGTQDSGPGARHLRVWRAQAMSSVRIMPYRYFPGLGDHLARAARLHRDVSDVAASVMDV